MREQIAYYACGETSTFGDTGQHWPHSGERGVFGSYYNTCIEEYGEELRLV